MTWLIVILFLVGCAGAFCLWMLYEESDLIGDLERSEAQILPPWMRED